MAEIETASLATAGRRHPDAGELGAALADARAPLSHARHLPGYIYTSPELYALEKEKIFMTDWLCVARVEEIEQPGDFMTFDILGDPIVVTRDEDGALHAFSNLCRHRGVEVAQGSGNAKEFTCPYHGWLYDLKGRLTGAPYMKESEGFDPTTCRLKPLLIDVWAGWVFVNFDRQAAPLSEFLSEFDQAFAFLKMEDCRVADKLVFELECNWKFVAENLLDLYHAQAVHGATFGRHIADGGYPMHLDSKGGASAFYDAAPHTHSGKPLFGTMPALAGKPESFGATGFLQPNLHMFARCENFRPCVNWPLSPTRSRLVYYNIFPSQFFDRADFADGVAEYRKYYEQVVEEDTEMIESLQRAMTTACFEPGRLSSLERAVHRLINTYLDRIFGAA